MWNKRVKARLILIFSTNTNRESVSSILLGYDIGVMSGAMIYIKRDLKINDLQIGKVCKMYGLNLIKILRELNKLKS